MRYNLLITDNAMVFWKVYLWARSLLIYQNGFQSDEAVDFTSVNVQYFIFWISCLYNFNPLSLLLRWVTTLVATTYRNIESRQSCKTTYMTRTKESERRHFFRLNILLHDSYQADEIVMEIKEWKQKVPIVYVKSFSRVLLSVLETWIVS